MAYTPSIVGQYATRMGRPRNIWDALSNISGLASVYFGEQQEQKYLQAQDAQKRQFDLADQLAGFERQKELIRYRESLQPPVTQKQPDYTLDEMFVNGMMTPEQIQRYQQINQRDFNPPSASVKEPSYTERSQKVQSEQGIFPIATARQLATDEKTSEGNRLIAAAASDMVAALQGNEKIANPIAKTLGIKKSEATADIISQMFSSNPTLYRSRLGALPETFDPGLFSKEFDVKRAFEGSMARLDSANTARSVSPMDLLVPAQAEGVGGYKVDTELMYLNPSERKAHEYLKQADDYATMTPEQRKAARQIVLSKGLVK